MFFCRMLDWKIDKIIFQKKNCPLVNSPLCPTMDCDVSRYKRPQYCAGKFVETLVWEVLSLGGAVSRCGVSPTDVTGAWESSESSLQRKNLVSSTRGNRLSGWGIDLFSLATVYFQISNILWLPVLSPSSFLYFFLLLFFSFKMKLELGRW